MGSISFDQIPSNYRAPSQFVEFDNSMAMQGATPIEYNVLFIGQKVVSGTAKTLKTDIVTTVEQAIEYYGPGSQLALMVDAFRKNDQVTKLFCLALDDDVSSVSAKAEIAITGTVSLASPINLYIGGANVRLAARMNDTAEVIMQAAVATINAEVNLPCTAAYENSKLILTAKNAGEAANEIDVRLSYYDEVLPKGIEIEITPFANGAGNPLIEDALAVIGDDWYNVISMPYTDRANLRAMETELLDRWGPLRAIDGICICSKAGTFGDLFTFGTDEEQSNYQNISIVECHATPDIPFVRAAAMAGVVAFYGAIDPARPFQTLPLNGCLSAKAEDRLIKMEQNQLLFSGVATTYTDDGGVVRVQRLITNYRTSQNGAVDTSYLDVNTKLTLSYLRYDFVNTMLRKFPRHKLATDASEVAPGQKIMTPKLGKATAVAICQNWIELGLVELMPVFKEGLIVERNSIDPNRLDFRLTPDLVNQFRIGACTIQFLL